MSEVKISEKRLKDLERAASKLQALEAGGVDNWEWYSESLKEWRKEGELEDLIATYVDDILQVCSEEGDVEYPAGREAGHSILLGDAEDYVVKLLNKFAQEVSNLED
jgi:hypothetical protein